MEEDEPEDSKRGIGPQEWKDPDLASGSTDLLKAISGRTHLPEGEEAVRRVLREVYRHGRIRTRDLAFVSRLPLPVVAAVRRELEKAGLLARKGGAMLTEEGEDYVRGVLGISMVGTLICSSCSGKTISIGRTHESILKKLEEYSRLRPRPYTWLDQAFATPQTSVLRALFMLEEGDVEGRSILFLGDDDLTSVATGLLRAAKRITVIDVDMRLLDLIKDASEREDLGVESFHHDLRSILPGELRGKYDVVFTDPPYTIQGLRLFVSRGIEALGKKECGSVYLAFAHKPPEDMLKIQKALNEMGLIIRELIPRFNR
ncbi:MAG: bis-aminopropyl spermidine synthase family protein, partial [Candidatus Bathyarchaeota archaeon]|nr:bis-aminopropyl spermidine synthase family protein [Candidatus Bathyarchaeota archaeon]